MVFRKVTVSPDFPALEDEIRKKWSREKTFEQSLALSAGRPHFVFYDGPPFPTGAPHPGTLFVSAIKDAIGRYKTMRGYHVPRLWGWDCHGLPIETIAEKNLGIIEKNEIEKSVGVKKFNGECRRIVSAAHEQWRLYIDKIGRWVQFEDPYTTMSKDYMESVIWGFAEAYKKELIYQDYRVTPYCIRCQTPLSLSETRQDDATRMKQSRSVTVKFQIEGISDLSLVVWTTTPWTLPANLAIAVGPEIEYVVIESGDEKLIMASESLTRYASVLGEFKVIESFSGEELIKRNYRYVPPFSLDANLPANVFTVIGADFVTVEDGTGLVHLAPAFGEDDYWICKKHGISAIDITDSHGSYTAVVGKEWQGSSVLKVNSDIIRVLKQQNLVLTDSTIEHNYPHCWRCREPLIYKAVDAWYLSIDTIKDRMVALNETIEWHPADVRDGRFGQWVKQSRDWNISRNRYWATPIPVWRCTDCDYCEVLDSVATIEGRAGYEIDDLHKEVLDEVRYPCVKCSGTMVRTPEVLDCWFESGSMPFAHRNYPFADKQFKDNFPADVIVEATGQLRGWFYSLHVLSTAIFDSVAFRACKVLGTLLAADGKKLSKSAKNYTDCIELIDSFGADALRCYFAGSVAVDMGDLVFRDEGVQEQVRTIILPVWNALTFFTTYAEIDCIDHDQIDLGSIDKKDLQILDLYILSELQNALLAVTQEFDAFAFDRALRVIVEFLDVLNNWYIRRNRSRVWEEGLTTSKVSFFSCLYFVLRNVVQMIAPLCPFVAETMWEYLRSSQDPSSIHLTHWPEGYQGLIDSGLCQEVNAVRSIISAALSIRAKQQIRVRQPLKNVTIAGYKGGEIAPVYQEMIKDELNVKDIIIRDDEGQIAKLVVMARPRLLGPRLGGKMQEVLKALKEGNFKLLPDGSVETVGVVLASSEVDIGYIGYDGLEVVTVPGVAVVGLDTTMTDELVIEGDARDLIRYIQDFRKKCNLNIADRIFLALMSDNDSSQLEFILRDHVDLIAREVLAVPILESSSKGNIARSDDYDVFATSQRTQATLSDGLTVDIVIAVVAIA
jgi:isoleucyl-tRNA synthetase